MENTGIMAVEQNTQLSSKVFSDPEAFQNLFNIGKMFASSSLVPQAYRINQWTARLPLIWQTVWESAR